MPVTEDFMKKLEVFSNVDVAINLRDVLLINIIHASITKLVLGNVGKRPTTISWSWLQLSPGPGIRRIRRSATNA